MLTRKFLNVVAALAIALVAASCAAKYTDIEEFSTRYEAPDLLDMSFVRQQTPTACGAAALESITDYWGNPLRQTFILEQFPPAQPDLGYSMGELRSIAESANFTVFGSLEQPSTVYSTVASGIPALIPVKKPYQYQKITDYTLGAIIRRNTVRAVVGQLYFNHYVVLIGVDQNFVYILDPQDGYRRLSRPLFEEYWTLITADQLGFSGYPAAFYLDLSRIELSD
ncbi:cysteine peptidase family C39 domain-containing protein [Maricaulaceae bacterium NA33B04]|nr:cysteine peptidase family C39 domain-containing protein [Maricaulaceae bacterium NA33B04]